MGIDIPTVWFTLLLSLPIIIVSPSPSPSTLSLSLSLPLPLHCHHLSLFLSIIIISPSPSPSPSLSSFPFHSLLPLLAHYPSHISTPFHPTSNGPWQWWGVLSQWVLVLVLALLIFPIPFTHSPSPVVWPPPPHCLLPIPSVIVIIPPTIHPTSSCSQGWRCMVCHLLLLSLFPSLSSPTHSTQHPPHEQLLTRLEGGGVSFVIVIIIPLPVISYPFHPTSTPQAVACKDGDGWCVIWWWLPVVVSGSPLRLVALLFMLPPPSPCICIAHHVPLLMFMPLLPHVWCLPLTFCCHWCHCH